MPIGPCFEKSQTVLWALTPPDGILLHNFSRRLYINLYGLEKIVWDHLDGLHDAASIVALAQARASVLGMTRSKGRSVAEKVIARLTEGGFIVKRAGA